MHMIVLITKQAPGRGVRKVNSKMAEGYNFCLSLDLPNHIGVLLEKKETADPNK